MSTTPFDASDFHRLLLRAGLAGLAISAILLVIISGCYPKVDSTFANANAS